MKTTKLKGIINQQGQFIVTETINLNTDQQIIKEVFEVLMENLDTSKVMRFWSICNLGSGDYLELKDRLFENETVDSLSEKIKLDQENKTVSSVSESKFNP